VTAPTAGSSREEAAQTTGVASVPGRRDRVRAATAQEIRQAARRIVLERGPRAASIRAVAAEMGMTPPGLYRYFAGRQELLKHVAADILTDLASDIDAAAAGAGTPGETDPADRLAAACWEFRRWSLSHPAAFGMLFGAPLPGGNAAQDKMTAERKQKLAAAFLGPFRQLWRTGPFPVPADDQIDPGLRRQLECYHRQAKADLPVGAVLVFLRCWVRLYGSVATQLCGHPNLALDDAETMFQHTLATTLPLAGIRCAGGRPDYCHPLAPQAQPPLAHRPEPRPAWPAQAASSAQPRLSTENQAAS